MLTCDCKEEFEVYFHGTTSNSDIDYMLLPPCQTDNLSETGRKKNLDRVFFTKDKGLAEIYAGRACRVLGGERVVYRVINPVDVKCLDDRDGASVYHSKFAFVEQIK